MNANMSADYRISFKVRNARLLRAIERNGFQPGKKLAELIGIRYHDLCKYLSLTLSPYDKNGDLRQSAQKICIFLNVYEDELWSDEQLIPLSKNSAFVDVTSEQVNMLIGNNSPEEILEIDDIRKTIHSSMLCLNDRQRYVISSYFGLEGEEKSLAQIGKELGVCQERAREIELIALRKLRMPGYSESLASLYVDD